MVLKPMMKRARIWRSGELVFHTEVQRSGVEMDLAERPVRRYKRRVQGRGVQVRVGERRTRARGSCALQATKGIRIGLLRQGEVTRGLWARKCLDLTQVVLWNAGELGHPARTPLVGCVALRQVRAGLVQQRLRCGWNRNQQGNRTPAGPAVGLMRDVGKQDEEWLGGFWLKQLDEFT